MSSRKKTTYWFWVGLRTITMEKSKRAKVTSFGEVWDNLCLIEASDEKEAYKKATTLGHLMEGGRERALRYNGEPAYCRFLGVTEMGFLYDGLEDGAEILYRSSKQTLGRAKREIKAERLLLGPIKKDLELARKVAAIPIEQLTPAPPPSKLVKMM